MLFGGRFEDGDKADYEEHEIEECMDLYTALSDRFVRGWEIGLLPTVT